MTPKTYAERGVQAGSSRVYLATFSPTPKTPLAPSPLGRRSSLGSARSRRLFSPDDSQDSHMESILEDVEFTSSPIKPAERSIKNPPLPQRVGPSKQIQGQRAVSMPENTAIGQINTTQTRVVSMPQRVRPAGKSPSSPAAIGAFDLSGRSDGVEISLTRTRFASHGSEVPCTPSPPSSPESVLITINQDSLPRSFLRKKSGPSEQPDSEGEKAHISELILLNC